ncbi:hypothetical protein SALBM311S_07872 [Streptomyces alboniger]
MDTDFTAEQDEIRRTLRALLRDRCGPAEVRAAVDTPAGHDPALWSALAEQLGLPGLALPDTYGGVGGSVTDLALACEETGRFLAPSPLLPPPGSPHPCCWPWAPRISEPRCCHASPPARSPPRSRYPVPASPPPSR